MPEHVLCERRGATALITLRRPPANALNQALLTELHDALQALAEPGVAALVLTGDGRFFSAGLDLKEVFVYPPPQADAFARLFDDTVTALFALPIPVVAAVNGHAIAGGAVLAAGADFRLLAAGDAQLGLTEILVGIPFPTSAFEVVRTAWQGPFLAEMLYRGRKYAPAEALARHFVDEVVAPGQLLERALALAEELGSRPRVAFSSSKLALRREALARMAAARHGADGADPVWTQWRTPEVMASLLAYRSSLGSSRPAAKKE